MAVNVHLLASTMSSAARAAGVRAPSYIRSHPLTDVQFRRLAGVTADIDTLLRDGKISEARAREMYLVYEAAARDVLRDDGADELLAHELLGAAARVITGPVGRIVAGGLAASFKAGKDL